MDQPTITTPREQVPEWATAQRPLGVQNRATQPQLDYISGLMRERDLSSLSNEQRDSLMNQPEEFWVSVTTRLSKEKASRIIATLKELPRKPHPPKDQIALPEVPAGRYAVENLTDGELRFYKVWRGRTGFVKLYVLHGPDEKQMNFKTAKAVMQNILDTGIRACAIRYGMEIGECSNCGRRLTNRISRELGIGPVCGGRMFEEDDWKNEVKRVRENIRARGQDPDEELD